MLNISCVERFDFNTADEPTAVIVEGQISDVSANEYFEEFQEMRYFEVRLSEANVVKNVRDQPIVGAEVELYSEQTNEYWDYTAGPPGTYKLMYPDFKALPGTSYKVIIKLSDGGQIESGLDKMPDQIMRGNIFHEEASEPQYVIQVNKTIIKDIEGVDVQIEIPEQLTEDFRYFKWSFLTTWLLKAELSPAGEFGMCWVTEKYYLDDYVLLEAKNTGLSKDLFFLETNRNLNIKYGFGVRVNQTSLSRNYYQFWTDLQNQQKQAELFAPPPYNAFSNLQFVDSDKDVYGFFGVVREQNYLWYLNLEDLTYDPYFPEICFVDPPFTPAPSCFNCLAYNAIKYGDEITNIRPKWWMP